MILAAKCLVKGTNCIQSEGGEGLVTVIFFQKDSEDALSLCKKEAFKKFGTLSLKDR